MKYLFLGGYYPCIFKEQIKDNSKRGFQMAANVFQESLLDGFLKNNANMKIISFPFLSTYPFGYKSPIVKGEHFSFSDRLDGEMISFINMPFLRYRVNNLYRILESSIAGEKDICVIIYSAQAHLLNAAIKLKRRNPFIKTCLIVPDLPEFMGCNRVYKALGLRDKDLKSIYKSIDEIDSFVFLTDSMAEHFGVNNKPWVRIEGIYTPKTLPNEIRKEGKVILYAGALLEKYGIKTLIEAFQKIEDKDYSLWICGDGAYLNDIQQICKYDERIVYKGLVSHDEVLVLQQKASLLVNPRTPEGEYTKYSFPSKTMEYIASGTPTLMYRLPAMPDEYLPYFFQIESMNDSLLLSKQIQTICEMESHVLKEFGVKASSFIVNNKNSKLQVEKIIKMLNKLF